jgi:hypothetical protein
MIYYRFNNLPAMACKPPAKNPPEMAPVMAAKAAPAGKEIICRLVVLLPSFRVVVVVVVLVVLDDNELDGNSGLLEEG